MAQFDNTNVSGVSNVLILGSILTLLVVLSARALYYVIDSDLTDVRVTDTTYAEVTQLKATHVAQLHKTGKDAKTKKISIDIERAKQLVVRKLNK